MEIPEINMLDFEAGIKCLQNPSFISRFFSFPAFWKWGALLIFAIFATFSSLIRRIKLIFIHFHSVKPSSNYAEDVFEFSDDDDDVSLASSDDEQEREENRPTTSSRGQQRVDEDFCVRGSIMSFKSQWQGGQLRQRRRRSSCVGGAWPEFASGKNVVKLWDSLGFTLDIDEDLFNCDPDSVVSTWENHREEKRSDFSGDVWGVAAAAPTVLLTAERNGNGDGVIVGGYDTRMRSGVPALYAEWKTAAEKVAADVSATGASKVYVRDDVSGVVTVGDVRNVRRPLESVRESDGDTWWDADAVIVENEFESSE